MKLLSRYCLTFFVFTLSASLASAGIGQTSDQIIEAFGQPKSQDAKTSQMTWEMDGGILYTVAFDADGKSWLEQVALPTKNQKDISKNLEKLRGFANKHFGDEEQWDLIDSTAPKTFGGRKLETVHGVIYWRLSKDGKQASAMHVFETPLIGIITPDYAKNHPKASIFAGY